MSMNYSASVEDYFKHPKWGMNTLLGGVCCLIPLIGPLVLSGWIITQLWAQGDEKDPVKLPAFDFDSFTKYLMRGLWPFLVQLVAGIALGIVMMILMMVVVLGMLALIKTAGEAAILSFPILFLIFIPITLLLGILFNLILVPLRLKATLVQEFSSAFDFSFVKNFISTIWKEMILSALFMFVVSIAFLIIGAVIFIPTLGFGVYFLMPPMSFAWQHLIKQLYELHVARGGIAVAKSPKLSDAPPSLSAEA